MSRTNSRTIDNVLVHMYKMGTGDCFVLKFLRRDDVAFKLMIDCGYWSRKQTEVLPFLKTLKEDVDNHVDALVVTHEHTDHVSGFEAGKDLFTDGSFKVDRVWMGWTEEDGHDKVERWKTNYGEKKRALHLLADQFSRAVAAPGFGRQFGGTHHENELLQLRRGFSETLTDFSRLHFDSDDPNYKGPLKGMRVVKEKFITDDNTTYFKPGETIENLPGLDGVRIYVLGPPKLYDTAKKEHGEDGESFEHNQEIDDPDLLFRAAKGRASGPLPASQLPFDSAFTTKSTAAAKRYEDRINDWRRIDDDWLMSAGQFALRMNSLTNNLSLALAIEFIDSGKVLLFPGDAEFGSWQSWHKIPWNDRFPGLTTENLLNRVVFYKVAHHLSHNGTARSQGLDMMTSPDLVAMATLDFDVISKGWKSTMPNRLILKQLLEQTRGRTMIMNTKDLYFDLSEQVPLERKIAEYRKRMSANDKRRFNRALDVSQDHFIEYRVAVD